MEYVQFPWIIELHVFGTFTATLKKVCTKVTYTPETPQDYKSKTVRATRPEGQLAQRNEDTRPKG